MAKPNRTCHSCSSKYYYCPSCQDDNRDPRIYIMWCSERCKNIFNILTDETLKKINTSECKEQLTKMGVTSGDGFRDGVKTHISRILNYNEPIIENEEEVSIEETSLVIENVEEAKFPTSSYTKKRKRNIVK